MRLTFVTHRVCETLLRIRRGKPFAELLIYDFVIFVIFYDKLVIACLGGGLTGERGVAARKKKGRGSEVENER